MGAFDFDLITIGAGSGGVRASRISSSMGAKVAIVENMRTGGTCVMRGCVPKKLLVYGSQFAEAFEDSIGFGWTPGKREFDWSHLIRAKNQELTRLEEVYHNILKAAGVTEIKGTGRFLDPHTIDVQGNSYTAKHILIATGGWPSLPDIPGIEHVITSNEALELDGLPKSIIIVGGGFIAVEFAGIFNSLGTKVDELIRAPNILRGFDESIRDCLSSEMEKKGINIHNSVNVALIEKTRNKNHRVTLDSGVVLNGETVMYATGRTPNTKGLGLSEVNIKTNKKGAIVVDKYSKTSVENVFAIGDVTDRMNLTPVALAEGMAFAQTLFGEAPTAMNYQKVPCSVFSQPPIGVVGLTEDQARQQEPIDVYFSSFRPMKHTLSNRKESCVMKLIVSRKTDRVLGCHMMGQDAPEIIQGIAIALNCNATKTQFDSTVGIHPTTAEEFVTMREKVRETEN